MTDEKRQFDAIALAMEVEIVELVRVEFALDARIARARRRHRRRSHLIRARQLAKAAELAEAA